MYDLSFVRHDHELLVIDLIPERSDRQSFTTLGFLGHTALDLFGEVDAVIFVHSFDHCFEDHRHLIIADIFGNAHNFDAELFTEHRLIYNAVLAVTRKTAEFPHKDDIERLRLRLCHADHALELGALVGFATGDTVLLDEYELVGEQHIVRLCITANRGELTVR